MPNVLDVLPLALLLCMPYMHMLPHAQHRNAFAELQASTYNLLCWKSHAYVALADLAAHS
jgi:hypothetical protein